jgi:hypothetical protein
MGVYLSLMESEYGFPFMQEVSPNEREAAIRYMGMPKEDLVMMLIINQRALNSFVMKSPYGTAEDYYFEKNNIPCIKILNLK